MVDALRKQKGCFGVSTNPYFKETRDKLEINYFTCPGNVRRPATDYVFDLFAQYEKGIRIKEESYEDWPAKLVQAFGLIAELKNEYQEKQRKNQERLNGGRSIGKNHHRR